MRFLENYLTVKILPLQDTSITLLLYRKDLIEKLISDAEWREKYVALAKQELGRDLEPKYPANWNWDDFYVT